MRLFAVAAFLALAACQPAAEKPATPVSEAEKTGQDEPGATMEPAPDPTPVAFAALSKTAIDLTGPIALSAMPRPGPNAAPRMKLATDKGLVLETELIPGGADDASRLDWQKIFGGHAPSIDMHSVLAENLLKGAKGGLCGAERTGFIAMATGLEDQGKQKMSIAAFKDEMWPPDSDAGLCGVFSYAPPAPPK